MSYVRPYARVFALSIGGMVVVAGADSGFVVLLKPIMDHGFVGRDEGFIQVMPFLLIGVFLVRGVGTFADTYGLTWVARKTIADLRNAMFDRMVRMPAAWYDANSSGVLVARLVYHVEQVAATCTSSFRTVVRDTLTVLFLLGWMTWLSVYLTLVFLVVSPLVAVVVRITSGYFRTITRRIQESMAHITEISREAFNVHRLIKTNDGRARECERFGGAVRFNTRAVLKQAAALSISVSLLMLVVGFGIGAVLVMVTWFSGLQQLSAGSFTSYLGAVVMLLSPVKRLANVNASIQAGLAAAESVFATLDAAPETDDGERVLDTVEGRVGFRNVSFRYGGEHDVLRDICFEIEPGATVALVGSTGSGKSTIVDLLFRLYRPTGGSILLDNVPVEELRLCNLRRHVAVVQQDSALVNDTIAANITYGESAATHDEQRLRRAAEGARVMEFAERMPQGLETRVGEGGGLLSGGQRQRVCIARALYRDAPVLALDEATSSLDNHSERLIQEAMDELRHGRTTFVIAHRLSTIEHADHILVLEQGHIVERGTHAELLAHGEIYAALHRARRKVGKPAAPPPPPSPTSPSP